MNSTQTKALIAANNQGSKSNKTPTNYRTNDAKNVASPSDILRNFRQVLMNNFNHVPDEIKLSGKIERFSTTGKRTDQSAWYVCHEFDYYIDNRQEDKREYHKGMVCAFGDWRSGTKEEWCSVDFTQLSDAEQSKLKTKQREQVRQHQAEQQAKYQQAQQQALSRWNASPLASSQHPYLVRKQCGAYGIKQSGQQLLIPVCDLEGDLHGLQFIDPNGGKKFLSGTAKRGHFCLIGSSLTHFKGVYLCEGYATGASLFEAYQQPVLVAFDAGNLLPVAQAYKKRYPYQSLTVCADNDRKTLNNPGLSKARELVHQLPEVGLIVPEFPSSAPLDLSDFNDLTVLLRSNASEGYAL
ncbi:toprim domain-containing protein [uncultured Thiothrix sp.]|uniref:toprim domain-containing protein n=1 Tax=uncultured Thiothrix sp. TaxID=223185 RepID=UPI002625DFAB|nr:toprim domain-containing protein [uncultured Thiothrix sp.]